MKLNTTLALSGTLLVGLLGGAVLTGMAEGQTGPSGVTLWGPAGHTGPNPWQLTVKVAGIPSPDQMMRVVEGTPFTVPAGKVFVVTGLGGSNPSEYTERTTVLFDGMSVLGAFRSVWDYRSSGVTSTSGSGPSVVPVPPGLIAGEGVVVTASAYNGDGVVLGYLADA